MENKSKDGTTGTFDKSKFPNGFFDSLSDGCLLIFAWPLPYTEEGLKKFTDAHRERNKIDFKIMRMIGYPARIFPRLLTATISMNRRDQCEETGIEGDFGPSIWTVELEFLRPPKVDTDARDMPTAFRTYRSTDFKKWELIDRKTRVSVPFGGPGNSFTL